MEATLTQPRRVKDDTPMGRKLLFWEKNPFFVRRLDGIPGISTG
jgi:hypothetical protein